MTQTEIDDFRKHLTMKNTSEIQELIERLDIYQNEAMGRWETMKDTLYHEILNELRQFSLEDLEKIRNYMEGILIPACMEGENNPCWKVPHITEDQENICNILSRMEAHLSDLNEQNIILREKVLSLENVVKFSGTPKLTPIWQSTGKPYLPPSPSTCKV